MAAVLLHPRIEVLTSSEVTEVTGHLGNFQVTVRQDPPLVGPECDLCGLCREVCPVTLPSGERFADPHRPALYQPAATAFPPGFVIDPHLCTRCGLCVAICPQGAIDLAAREARLHFAIGALVVATGAKPYDFADGPQQAWAALPRVATTLDLERLLAESPHSSAWDKLLGPEPPRDLAFILCVGSRQEHGNRYCSRICCPTALHQALELRERFPQTRIHIYFRDIRTGKPEWEDLYRRAREAGILFHRGRVHDLQTSDAGRVLIEFEPLGASESLSDSVDAAILAVGLTPGGGRSLKSALRLPLSSDGFFLEAHPKLRPLETALDCVYLAGTCQGPKDLGETLTQASGAASKILSLFAHETLTLEGILCAIDPAKCQGCGLCARQCPFQAIEMVPVDGATQAQIIPSACKGCGVCAGACPEGAVIAHGFTDEMIAAQIDNALADNPAGKILAFCCNWCSYAGADFAGVSRLEYPAAVRIIRTMCAGRVHPKFIRRALEKGAGQVLVTGCHPPGDCHYLSGNLRAQARVAKLKQKLPSLGLDPHRLHLAWISATEGRAFQQLITQLAQELQTNSSSSTTTVPEATP
jgi:heterodisulfide reductase subunit A